MPNPVYGTLSNTFRSDRTFTPLAPARETASKFLYDKSGHGQAAPQGQKWGRGEDYGLHISSSDNDRSKIKGHRHFSAGMEYLPSEVAQYQVYNLTALKRSNTRPHDHLVLEPQKINIQDSQIKLDFPQQPVYFSHLSQKDVFPQHKPPTKTAAVIEEEVDNAEDSDGEYDVEPTLAFNREFKPDLRSSTKGCPWRTETLNSDWRPSVVPRPAEHRVTAETFNKHKSHLKSLKETHYSRTHGYAINALSNTAPANRNLMEYKPSWKHDILKAFNEKHSEPMPDVRKPKEKKHIFYGVNTMNIEHG